MRVVLDATPLLGQRTGVGRYVENLLAALADLVGDEALGLIREFGALAPGSGAVDAAGASAGARSPRAAGPDGPTGPALAARAGNGRPPAGAALAAPARSLDLAATAFTWRGLAGLAEALPPGVGSVARRAPARLLQESWVRGDRLPAELLVGHADVVHATNFVLPPLRAARGVLTIHDLSYLRTPDTVSEASARYATLVPRGLRRAAAVITPSQAIAEEVIAAYRLDPDRVTATPLGVDGRWFDAAPPKPEWLRERGFPERYLLFVGNAEPRKNLGTLLSALRGLHGTYPDIPPLVLVGPPGWGPALDTAGLPAGAVHGAGYLSEADLRTAVAGAVALCFPSRYEGFGLPPLEALAAGTPVIAADIPAVREVTAPVVGTAVRLVPPTDVDRLADALLDVIDGGYAGLSDGLGGVRRSGAVDADPREIGRRHARAFTWRRTAALTAAVYRRAAGS
ncbi:glycosyltransferase family 4 protein [Frankia nepalensis]|uniref:glycosyltransferase family 4 protein n=1 Tax=Frankia nepalensis TaxID=1836974 RepID=UPI001EE498A4